MEFNEELKQISNADLKAMLSGMKEADIAEWLESLDDPLENLRVLKLLTKDVAAEVFAHLSSESQELILNALTDAEVASLFREMFVDDAVDVLEEMPANIVKKVMAVSDEGTRKLLNQFLNYSENTAGSIMTSEFADLKKEMTVKEAFERIRRTALQKETVYTCYVVDSARVLEGVVSVKTLLLSKPDEVIGDIMTVNIVHALTSDDREHVLNLFKKYGFISLPVTDKEKRLVGIVTVDDILAVQEEEHTEDIEKMAGLKPGEKSYRELSVFALYKNRIGWLLFLMVSAFLTGFIMRSFEERLSVALILSVPMLMDTGGNAGAQSSTMVIRGMTLNQITQRDIGRVFVKELLIGLLVSIALVPISFIKVYFFDMSHAAAMASLRVSLTVCFTMVCVAVLAKVIGGMLPFLAKKLRLDPAVAAAPLVATIMDSCTLLIYFGFAGLLAA